MAKNLPPQKNKSKICWLSKKKYKYKTLERGGGWAQSNQKTIEVTLKKVKNINIPNHENLSLALISEHFDGD